MAAPSSKTLQSLSGKWTLNKSLSDDYMRVLSVQGVSTLLIKAIGTASVHLTITQPSNDHIKMEQTATAAAIPGTTEEYTLDWQWRTNKDAFFGNVEGRSRWIGQDEARKEGVEGEWEDGSEGKLINAVGRKPDGTWEAVHFWGFEEVGGERRHTRRVTVRNQEGEKLKVRMVYDFNGE